MKSVQFLPGRAQKRTRYRNSLHGGYTYSNVKERRPSRVHVDFDTRKPLPANKQNKIRFFGFLHQRVDHGPSKAAKRFEKAEARWEAGFGSKTRCSMRMRDRMRSYM